MSNPYNYSTLVTDPKMFFGRKATLNSLCTRLKNMQSTSIVGLRRIGKSSLLYQLTRALPVELGQAYVPLYIDLQDARYRTVIGFVEEVTEALHEKLGGSLAVSNAKDMPGFSKMINQMSDSGVRPILCVDEFEEFTYHSEEFNDDFLEALRSLGGQGKLAMVTASRKSLIDLIKDEGLTSPFYNIFSQRELGLLEPDASRALRCEPFEREKVTLSLEYEILVEEMGGRYPFYLQMACYYLYEELRRHERAQTDLENVVRRHFDNDAKPHFERLWSRLSAEEQAALRVTVGKAVSTNDTEQVLERLGHLGVVEQADGKWRPFSARFARCVSQYPVQPLDHVGVTEVFPDNHTAPAQDNGSGSLSDATRLLLFAGTAVVVVITAALIGSLVPAPKFRQVLIVSALILLFALVGAGKLTGHDFLRALGKLLGLGGS